MKIHCLIILIFLLLFSRSQAQIISTCAGNGSFSYSGDNAPATSAAIGEPYGVASDYFGNLYIADVGHSVIRKINNAGIITTIAGTGVAGFSGDNGPATAAQLYGPSGIAVDLLGNLFIADENNRIRKVNMSTGIITTVAGNGTIGYSGDNGPATAAELSVIMNVAVDSWGNIYIGDGGNNVVRKVNASTGIITTFAGYYYHSGPGAGGFAGDNGPATAAELQDPGAIAVDSLGNVYIADANNNRIRKVNTTGIITTFAGTGGSGHIGDNGAATAAEIGAVLGLAADNSGNIFISDGYNNIIRKVDPAGIITTYAGNGMQGFSGDNGPAILAMMNEAYGISVDSSGILYIADASNARIRKVTSVPARINEQTANTEITLLPNPTNGNIFIRGAEHLSIKVYDVIGQLIKEEHNANNISIVEFPSGMYFINLFDGQGQVIKQDRIVKL